MGVEVPVNLIVQLVANSRSVLATGGAGEELFDDAAEEPGLPPVAGLELFDLRKDGTGAPGGTPAVSVVRFPALHGIGNIQND